MQNKTKIGELIEIIIIITIINNDNGKCQYVCNWIQIQKMNVADCFICKF